MYRIILLSFVVITLFLGNISPSFAVDPTKALTNVAGKAEYKTSATLEGVAGSAVKGFLSVVGVLLLALLLYGGYTWMNAQGNEEEVAKAKKIITAAIIGLVIIMASYSITDFVLEKLENATLAE